MKHALIVSLNFNPGHVSHLIASYRQLSEIGYETHLYINKGFQPFLPAEYKERLNDNIRGCKFNVALFLFPSIKNVGKMIFLRSKGTKIIYILHEPLDKLKNYILAGFNLSMLIKVFFVGLVNAILVNLSNSVILPSLKAIDLYRSRRLLYWNSRFRMIPLLYDDESNATVNLESKRYFSYIGTIATDHSFIEFLSFVEHCITNETISELNFLVATKSPLKVDHRISQLQKTGRLEIVSGTPLTNYEINEYYKKSLIVWNAYSRTTQSGVLPKAFMFGCSAIILKRNLSDFAQHKQNVYAITENNNFEQITKGVRHIITNKSSYSKAARDTFLSHYYYKIYNKEIHSFINC